MVRDVAAARKLCEVDAREREHIGIAAAADCAVEKTSLFNAIPISIAEAVAPGNPYLGVMLPYTPLHHLLMDAAGGLPLVMTSGNRSDEPIAYTDADALERLAGHCGCVFDAQPRNSCPL